MNFERDRGGNLGVAAKGHVPVHSRGLNAAVLICLVVLALYMLEVI